MQDLLELKNEFSRRGILISFNGPFNHSIIEEIGIAAKTHLEGHGQQDGVITDVFSVYIEQTQNASKYIGQQGLKAFHQDSAIVVIRQRDGGYEVVSGNTIFKTDVPALTQHLEMVNSLDRDGLKKLYKEILRKERPATAQGAGVGIIEMARRASDRLAYSFRPLDERFDFFTLTVFIGGA